LLFDNLEYGRKFWLLLFKQPAHEGPVLLSLVGHGHWAPASFLLPARLGLRNCMRHQAKAVFALPTDALGGLVVSDIHVVSLYLGGVPVLAGPGGQAGMLPARHASGSHLALPARLNTLTAAQAGDSGDCPGGLRGATLELPISPQTG
jgi:hypothetical protein